jgi:hypothetical protein
MPVRSADIVVRGALWPGQRTPPKRASRAGGAYKYHGGRTGRERPSRPTETGRKSE